MKAWYIYREAKVKREAAIKDTTIDTVAGLVSTNVLSSLAQEKVTDFACFSFRCRCYSIPYLSDVFGQDRVDYIRFLQEQAGEAVDERRMVEATEAGRRQKVGLTYPAKP